MAVEAGQSGKGTDKSELQANAVGLPGILMQGIATIGPSFAILASFVFIVGFAGIVTPWAFLFGGILLGLQALSAAHWPRCSRPPAAGTPGSPGPSILGPGSSPGCCSPSGCRPSATLTLSFLAKTCWSRRSRPNGGGHPVVDLADPRGGAGDLLRLPGIAISEKVLIITGGIEIVIMVALAFTGLVDPARAGSASRRSTPVTSAWRATCSWGWCSRSSRSAAGNPPGRWPRRARTPSATCRSGWSARSSS